jgi:hypothetical protein
MSAGLREPALVLVSGPAGSGKTTLSERLCRALGLPIVDYDSACEPFLAILQEKDGAAIRDSAFTRRYREACYAAFFDLVFANVALGLDLVATAPLSDESGDPAFFDRMRERYGLGFYSIDAYIGIGEEDLHRNIVARDSERDREKLADWEGFLRRSASRERRWAADCSICVRSRGGYFDEGDFLLLARAVRERP